MERFRKVLSEFKYFSSQNLKIFTTPFSQFQIGTTTCEIITKKTSNELVYSLKVSFRKKNWFKGAYRNLFQVDNKPFEEFRNSQYKEFERWEVSFKGEGKFNIVLGELIYKKKFLNEFH